MTGMADFSWLHLFAEYLIKSTLALTLGLILVQLFRKRSASLRHFVLSLALAGLLLLPILSSIDIGWETALLPAGESAVSAATGAPRVELPGKDRAENRQQINASFFPLNSFGATVMPGDGTLPASQSSRFIKSALPFIWSVGFAILLLRLAAGILGAFRLTREGEAVRDPRWRVLLERFLAVLHLQKKVRLKSHPDVLVPLTWGFIKPVVLIPDGHEAWTEEQRSSALVHELWHVKRADFLVMVIVRLSLALFWFNPLSWVVFRRLKNEQEEACDELVLRTGIKPSTYAANLLFFKSTAGSRLGYFAALLGLFGFGKSAFNERLASILKQKWTFKEVKMKTKIMLSCAVILTVGLIGMARPSTPAGGDAEAAVGSLIAAGPSVLEKISYPESAGIQGPEQAQQQSQAEQKKAKEKQQQEQAQAQQEQVQAQEKQEQKEEMKKAVVWTIKEGEKNKYQIKIQEGDKIKTIVVDAPIVIKEGKEGKVFIITPEGKEVKVLGGVPVHLQIMGDKLEFIKEGKVLKVGKDGSSFYVSVKPDVDVSKAVKIALKNIPVTVEALDIATPHITWVGSDEQQEIREKLREVREKLKKAKEENLDLREVEEALADLEKDLEKMSQEISTIGLKLEDKPVVYTIAKKVDDKEAAAEVKVDIMKDTRKDSITVVADKKGSFVLSYQIDAGEKGREAYEKIVARVKKDLPEGFTLEPEFEEESGLITLKIRGPVDKGAPKDLLNKLADSIRDETKEKKE